MQSINDPDEFMRLVARARAKSSEKAWSEASRLWEEVVTANPFHRGSWAALAGARYESHEYDGARTAYERVLQLGEGFPAETRFRIACCHAMLGALENALTWLQSAFEHGYRHLEQARTEAALEGLHDNPRFREIVALIDTSGMSRDEGWRSDLALLSREVKRRGYALFAKAKGHAPFQSAPEPEFDAAVGRIHAAIPQLTEVEIVAELMKLLRLPGDGHSGLHALHDHPLFQQALPLQLYLFEEGLYVTGTSPEYESLLGARILRVEDRSAEEVSTALDPLISRDNDQWVREMAPYHIRRTPLLYALKLVSNPGTVSLTLEAPDGTTRAATVAAAAGASEIRDSLPCPRGWRFFPQTLAAPVPLYLANAGTPYWYTYLSEDRLVYFQFNQVRDDPRETLAAFCARLFAFVEEQPIDRMALDLRWNHGGNTFLELPLWHGMIKSKLNRRGRLFVIIGRRTFSAAQNCATLLQRHTEAIFVGEPTGSSPNSVGETVPFELPFSGLRANVSDLFWQSSWPMDYRTWIGPDIYAPPTFASFRENHDPALDAILAIREHLPGW